MILLVLLIAAGGLALAIAAVLAVHVARSERQSRRVFRPLHRPLPPGPVPMLDTNPDGPRSDPSRLPFLDL
ncbi:hypothetical protein [Amycolatopsis sp. NPDC004079]|uniref:hypothetical protein n=1 Tax=Amycolatopsis sp. NPDC004079 TaxID=3154549 RepID=UPI0033B7F72E